MKLSLWFFAALVFPFIANALDPATAEPSRSAFGTDVVVYGATPAGKQYPNQPMKFSGPDESGNLLPLLTTKDAGADEDGDGNVMTYSFRLCVTANAANRVPFPEPARCDPARFEAVRRYFSQEKKPVLPWDLCPLPGDKADANNGIGKQFSMGIIGGGNVWCAAGPAERARIWETHRQYTLEMYRFSRPMPRCRRRFATRLRNTGCARTSLPAAITGRRNSASAKAAGCAAHL